jgi:8-oxo-dGTP pyrophosphatase MutT (NUDIX family)
MQNKVYAYITYGARLLVFRHIDFPEAGVQVPGGTLEAGECPADGVLREAREETGLTGLRLGVRLGEAEWRGPNDAVYHRTYYHLICEGAPPEQWVHDELYPSDGSPGPIRFTFSWAALPHDIPELSGDLDEFVPALCRHLRLI